MANEKANAVATAESVNMSAEQFTVDANVVDVKVAHDRYGNVIPDVIQLIFDKEFDTIHPATGERYQTNSITVHDYSVVRFLNETPLVMTLLQQCTLVTKAQKREYVVNPAFYQFLLKGAEIKFTKTFKAKGQLRYNGEQLQNDILQSDIVSVLAPRCQKGDIASLQQALAAYRDTCLLGCEFLSDDVKAAVIATAQHIVPRPEVQTAAPAAISAASLASSLD